MSVEKQAKAGKGDLGNGEVLLPYCGVQEVETWGWKGSFFPMRGQ
jgi:hypothetical protein